MSAIRVIQFTDPHLFGDAAGTLRGVNTLETLERTLSDRFRSPRHVRRHPGHGRPGAGRSRVATNTSGACSRALANPYCAFRATTTLFPKCARALGGRPFELDGPADISAWRVGAARQRGAQAGGRIHFSRDAHQAGRRTRNGAPTSRAGVPAPSPGRDAQPLAGQCRPRERRMNSGRSSTATRRYGR